MKKKTYFGLGVVIAGFLVSVYFIVYPFAIPGGFDINALITWFGDMFATLDFQDKGLLWLVGSIGTLELLWLVHLIVSASAKRLRKNLIASPFAFLAILFLAFVFPFSFGPGIHNENGIVEYLKVLFASPELADTLLGIVAIASVALVVIGLFISFFEKSPVRQTESAVDNHEETSIRSQIVTEHVVVEQPKEVVVEPAIAKPIVEEPAPVSKVIEEQPKPVYIEKTVIKEVVTPTRTVTTTTTTTVETVVNSDEHGPIETKEEPIVKEVIVKHEQPIVVTSDEDDYEIKKPSRVKPVAQKPFASYDDSNKIYHVSERKELNKWQVKAQAAEKALKLFNTQAEAIEYARQITGGNDGRVRVHTKGGKLRKF